MTKACVIGWPIKHSRSPIIHNYWLKQLKISGSYTKEAVPPDYVEHFLGSLEAAGFAGCNVTVPHKETAFARAQVKDASAIAVGAANTLWLEKGVLHAANTDTYGFISYLSARVPHWNAQPSAVSILGAGGAARAIVYGFLEAGCLDVRVFNRSQERGQALAAHFGSRVRAMDWDDRTAQSSDVSVLVNTTSVGMNATGELGIAMSTLRRDCAVADIVYVPLLTKFLADAQAAGLATVDGLGMLLHQAVPGFERWFGVRPEVTQELYDMVAADIGMS